MDLFIASEARDQLYQNNGDGTLTEVTLPAGLVNKMNGQGVAWGDYNNDGNMDIYIARGYSDIRDSLLWNSQGIAFSDLEVNNEDGIDFTTSGSEVTFDLYLNNCRKTDKVFIGSQNSSPLSIPFTITEQDALGKPLYIAGQDRGFFIWHDEIGWHIRWSYDKGTIFRDGYYYGRITGNGQFTSVKPLHSPKAIPNITNTLYKNNGNGTFTDVTTMAGVGSQRNDRGAVWGDYDNDGDLDLYVVNAGSFLKNGSNTLYRNNGNGTFTDVAMKEGVEANVEGRGDGAAWEDFNNDGFLDLFVTNGWGRAILSRNGDQDCLVFGPHLLYENKGNLKKWLKVTLVGTSSNRDAIGAKIILQAGGQTQYREFNGSGGGQFFSQGTGPIHFGLGFEDLVDSLIIQWPSGFIQIFTTMAPNQHVTIVEPG